MIQRRVMSILVMLLIPKVIKTEDAEEEPFHLVSCHYMKSPHSELPVIDEDVDPPERSIFFHETSCKGGLNSRQKCAVESAAKQNPTWQIYLLFSGDVPDFALPAGNLSSLLKIPNVEIYRIHNIDYAKNTPLEDFMSRVSLNSSRYSIQHTSDVLRFLTLYKYGGVYLDLDIVVVKPLDDLEWNYAAKFGSFITNSILAFSWDTIGWEVAAATIRVLVSQYDGTRVIHNGPGVITQVLMDRCNTTDVRRMTLEQCRGFRVYSPRYFFPVRYNEAERDFRPGYLRRGDEYCHHFWNKKTSNLKVHRNSPYAKLAKKFCPETYKLYNINFGT